jgi:hypothetical protein
MNMYPTGWGWITVGVGVVNLVFFAWKRSRKVGLRGMFRLVEMIAGAVLVICLLVSFAEWAEWYK